MSKRAKRHPSTVIMCWCIGACFVFAIFVGIGIYDRDAKYPPAGVVDLDGFMREMPTPIAAYELTIQGRVYYELIGPIGIGLSAPSGPPAYIFDDRGKLIASTLDDGDDPGHYQRWRAYSRRELTPDESERLVGVRLSGPGGPARP